MSVEHAECTTFDFIERHAETTPERLALIFHDESFTYRQFHGDAMRVTHALAELGVERGQVVIVSHPHFYLHWLLLIACENVGAISCSAVSQYVLAYADYVFAENDPPGRPNRSIFHRLDRSWLDDIFSRNLASVRCHPRISIKPHETQRITHSSGTTGEQKAMLLTRGAQEAKLMALSKSLACTGDMRVLATLVLSVNSSFLLTTLCLRLGILFVVAPLATALHKHRVNYFEVLPLHLEQMLAELPADFAKPPQLKIKVIGAPLTEYLQGRCMTSLCSEISGRYGTNEVWPIAHDMNTEGIGTVSEGVRVKIVDDFGRPLPQEQAGHIMVQSATMVDGYFNDPEATGRHFRNGWFLTGDRGQLLSGNRLQVLGRVDDILNLGGLKCYPHPVEEKIRSISGIADVAVTSIPSRHTVDDLCVAVVMEDSKVDRSDVFREIKAAVSEWPQIHIQEISALPRTGNGKLMRSAVRQLFLKSHGSSREIEASTGSDRHSSGITR